MAAPSDIVAIPDANLKACITSELGVPATNDVTQAEMGSLTDLTCSSQSVVALTGLEYGTNLDRLHLGSNAIVDISPIAQLVNLTDLVLDQNDIVDISALSGLTNVTSLGIANNALVNLSPDFEFSATVS